MDKKSLFQDFINLFQNNKRAITVVVCILIVGLTAYKHLRKKEDIEGVRLPSVQVTEAKFGPVLKYINAIGTLHPNNSVMLKSEVNAVVTKVHFHEGALVEKGTLLIELDDSNARAALQEAQAQYSRAMSEYEPTEKLADKGVMAKIERNRRKAEVDICAAKVASSQSNLEKHKIIAPFGGQIGLKQVNVGQYVAPGTELVRLVDCYPLSVDFKIGESDIGEIYVGQEVKILVGGDDMQEYQGRVVAIDPESEKISHTFNVRALLDVSEDAVLKSRTLKPGIFVSVKVVPDKSKNGVLIPESCLIKIGDNYLVNKVVDGLAVSSPVTLGVRKSDAVEIITGVNEGDIVIYSGNEDVLDGHNVNIIQESDSLSSMVDQVRNMSRKQ